MSPNNCPTDPQLRAFQLGDLEESSLTEVANHLESCPHCENRARRMDTEHDPILAGIRGSAAVWRSLPDVPTLPPPVAGPPVALPVAVECSAPISYTFLGPAQQPDEIGRLGNYRVLRLLGKGGMGYVFQAEDLSLGRPVALKIMKPELSGDVDNWQRFLREARAMAALKHDHLVTVYQVGQENGACFIAMELLEGSSLLDRLKSGPLQADQVVRLSRELAGALAAIHRHGLVHRDIKPANIWLEAPGDRVKLLDFGLARNLQDDVNLTQTGVVVGTPSFMSPEQARGLTVDARSDLFSLGAVLYCMSTGTTPFQGPNVTAVLTALAVEAPRPAREVNPAISPVLSDLITQLLAKKPEQRPPSAEAVHDCLQQMESSKTIPLAIPAGVSDRIKVQYSQWLGKTTRSQQLAILGVLLVLIAGVGMLVRGKSGNRPRGGTSAKAHPVFLKSLKPVDPVNWPLPPAPDGKQLPNFFAEIRVNGAVSPNGIGMHPSFDGPASVCFDLGKRFQTFEAKVGLNHSSRGTDSPMFFYVYGDGRVLWKSKPVETTADVHHCKISVQGVDRLKLEVRVEDVARGAHGAWIEPVLSE